MGAGCGLGVPAAQGAQGKVKQGAGDWSSLGNVARLSLPCFSGIRAHTGHPAPGARIQRG